MKLSMMMTMMLMLSCAASSNTPHEPWSVAVTSSGGLAGRGAGSYSINSAGEIAVTSMNGKSCTFRATDEELTRFREILTNAQPRKWRDSYVPEESCCDRFQYQLTVDEAGTKKVVTWIDNPEPMPPDLDALITAMVGVPPSLRVTYGGQCL